MILILGIDSIHLPFARSMPLFSVTSLTDPKQVLSKALFVSINEHRAIVLKGPDSVVGLNVSTRIPLLVCMSVTFSKDMRELKT